MEMEIENDNNETNVITANELYNRLEARNKETIDSFEDPKKKKKGYLKLKDLLIKFNKAPTPIKDVELIDIKLGSKIKEDDIFLHEDFIAEYIRRGESLFYNKSENTYDYARIGLPKFFDYKKKYEETESDKKLKERVLGQILKIAGQSKNPENLKFYAYLTTKVNGENFQVSYNTKYDCWIIASKNVSLAIRNKEDLEFYKKEENFKGYFNDDESGKKQIISEKEKKMQEKKAKKEEKKKKKKERLERRKKGKEEDKKDEDENEEEEKEEKNEIKEEEKEKDKKDTAKKKNILERYTFAIDFAETWLKIVQEKIINNTNKDLINEFKKELGNCTLIGESVGDKKREHILVYKERDIIFYGIVNNNKLLSQKCLPLSESFNLFKKYNLSYTEYAPSQKYNTLEELFNYINEQFDVIFDKSLQESGEGNVVYFSCDIDGKESIQGLGKLKTFEYRFFRKIREKCKAIPAMPDRESIEKDIKKKFDATQRKKDKKKKGKNETDEDKEKEIIKLNKKVDAEIKEKNEEREKKVNSLLHRIKIETNDLLKEVPKSKYNLDKTLINKYFNFGEYVINYRIKDGTNYFDVFASFIEIMKEKFNAKAEINDLLISEIKKRFEGLISNKETNEENEDQKE